MKLILCCNAGMSTSILVKKIEKYCEVIGREISIQAIPIENLKNHIEEIDMVLLGPQIRFKAKEVEELCNKFNKKYDIIPFTLYGTMNEKKILEELVFNKF